MTHQENYNLSSSTIEEMTKNGLEAIPELVRVILNSVMQEERTNYLQANAYERTEERKGHANGYKPKTVRTKLGDITFAIPQVREGGFYPSALEKGMRSERALLIALAEMYVQGVSTRRVKSITEELCGVEISSMQVSRAAQQLDDVLQEWRERSLGEIQYLYADARYEKVRDAGQVRDAAVLVASGISPEGERQVLGVSVSLSEHEMHSRKGTLRSGKPF
jgi:transposase-like protein